MIPTLRDTSTHHLAVTVWQRHHPTSPGICIQCGLPSPCPPRRHAATVITAAGDTPDRDEHLDRHEHPDRRTPPHSTVSEAPTPAPAVVTGPAATTGVFGYSLGGHGRRASPAGYIYDRDTE